MGDFTTVFLFTNNTKEIYDSVLRDFAGSIIGLVFLIIMLGGVWTTPRKKMSRLSAIALSVGLVAIGVFVGITTINENLDDKNYYDQKYQELLNAYNTQQYKVAEGEVHVLYAQPFSGHTKGDIINVGGVELEISYFTMTFGYNQTIAHNGVLTEGAYARIYYIDDVILRIDLKRLN